MAVPTLPTHIDPNEVPALFWDELPSGEDNLDAAAIQAIIDETTPEERAEGFKDQGNRALKTGLQHKKKFYLRQAIEQYTQGLAVACPNAALNSALASNRAHVNLLLGNFRNAYQDGLAALKTNPQNVKACYRAAKGALGMSKFGECEQLCSRGLELEPENKEMLVLRRRACEQAEAHTRREAEERRRQEALRGPAMQLADALLSRGWRIGRPQFSIGTCKPRVDEGGLAHWPVLLFYPQASMQHDTVEDFCEADAFRDHLDVMFGPEAPPLDWDARGEYSRDAVELYYLSHGATPLSREALAEALHGGWPEARDEGPKRYGPDAAGWVRVREGWALADALGRPDHVVPGIPVFFVLAKGTDFRERFLSEDMPLL